MMDKSMVKKLSSAGVDPAVIINLLLDEDEPEQAAGVRAEPAEAPAEPAPQVTQPEPEPRKDDAILAAIERLTGAVQAANIRNMSAGDPTQAETADSILASLIAPAKK
jgi:hypothetical protein